MIKKIFNFFKEYKQFAIVVVVIVLALPLDVSGLHLAAHIILGLTSIGIVIPLLWDMIQDLRGGTYGVDILAATAIIASVALGQFWAGIIIVLMLTGGEALEDYAEKRARNELDALLSGAPKKARILRGRKVIDIPATEVRVNDKIIIWAGELVPVDALIIDGQASFDESSLTGEALPVSKKLGEELLSGSINMDGVITARALRAAKDSQYEQIVRMVKSAAASKSPFVRLADRYSIPFTITAFVIAIGAWVISGAPIRFLEVLVVATPCPLILAAPIALISGMSQAAKRGIIIKNGSALERLADIKTLAFDKTGTLTKGQVAVSNVKAYGNFSKDQVLALAAAVEHNSNHVLAKAINQKAQQQNLRPAKAKNTHELPGNGLLASVQGKEILVGRLNLVEDRKLKLPKNYRQLAPKQTVSLVAVDGMLAGIISFKDELRPETKQTLSRLKGLGVKHFLMITGDNEATARAIAQKLGIKDKDVEAEALPADKLQIIENVEDRPVGFVGDGVNDAPVLAASDVGIALGARGSAAASESADAVIMLDDFGKVAVSIEVAKRTFYIATQSILVGIALSVALMFIFATGRFKPVYGAAIQEVVDVIVIFNALRAHSIKLLEDELGQSKSQSY
jgi:heavy metal translocating P-type ATPase